MFRHITRPEFLMIVLPAVMLFVVVEMVRRRRIREDYSLLWLGTFAVLVFLAIFRDSLLVPVAEAMGIKYHPNALFAIGVGLLLLISLHFSVVVTKLASENKQAAQHMALLSLRVRELERRLEQQQQES